MNNLELKKRTKQFAVNTILMCDLLPNKPIGWNITNQLVRSATSVGANYRAVLRSKSDKDFISKMETVIKEADESLYWFEIIDELQLLNKTDYDKLMNEADELTAIFVSSVKTIKKRMNSADES